MKFLLVSLFVLVSCTLDVNLNMKMDIPICKVDNDCLNAEFPSCFNLGEFGICVGCVENHILLMSYCLNESTDEQE